MSRVLHRAVGLALGLTTVAAPLAAQEPDSARIERLKAEAITRVDGRSKLVQEIIDHLFSFSELGMQEFETQRYLTGLLEQNGFTVQPSKLNGELRSSRPGEEAVGGGRGRGFGGGVAPGTYLVHFSANGVTMRRPLVVEPAP